MGHRTQAQAPARRARLWRSSASASAPPAGFPPKRVQIRCHLNMYSRRGKCVSCLGVLRSSGSTWILGPCRWLWPAIAADPAKAVEHRKLRALQRCSLHCRGKSSPVFDRCRTEVEAVHSLFYVNHTTRRLLASRTKRAGGTWNPQTL
ncbi:hypothetical protein PF010_g18072 [Phytophthora fragariae]|uniref:Uncharacterized protein n=1 Tax=Phytophthora fragariae TaxID=53985 RepID=A0A6G0KLX6_9STRA|nr:hypothetical protein PF010_g18072 [Phytophthora fragariae]